jgi:hypothetical protein
MKDLTQNHAFIGHYREDWEVCKGRDGSDRGWICLYSDLQYL